jgi:hypothetical protein
MQTLNLTKRPAKVGKNVNTRTEMHGKKEEVPAQDIPVTGIVLSVEELCALTDEPTAGAGLFKVEGDQYVPRFIAIDWFPIEHTFTGATIKLSGGVPSTTYKNCKIKGIWAKALGGAMTEIRCTLQVNPQPGDPPAQQLINAKIAITILKAAIDTEAEGEPELPLDHQASPGAAPQEGEEAVPLEGLTPTNPDVEETQMSRTGRKIQNSARRASRKK